MESLPGPINPCLFGGHLDLECLDLGKGAFGFGSYGGQFVSTEGFRSGEEAAPSLDDKMPFLQMLRSAESAPLGTFTEPNFHLLLRLQRQKMPWESSCVQAVELESCVTHDLPEMQSPEKSETREPQPLQNPTSASSSGRAQHSHFSESPPPVARERKKRKRTRPAKNKEEVENQRMTHIAVERNRRRQMNDHLTVLRSLMPTSYIQRGDQASIVGGAIDFVKELEQLLQSLEAEKRMRETQDGGGGESCSTSMSGVTFDRLFEAGPPPHCDNGGNRTAKKTGRAAAEIEATVIQTHVNMKIECRRRPGQLLKAIVALEDLRLTVLHLNITSLQRHSVLYSFNLKIEDDCKLGSADEIAAAVHGIFSLINDG